MRFFCARSPCKIIYIGAHSTFRKTLRLVSQKWMSEIIPKGDFLEKIGNQNAGGLFGKNWQPECRGGAVARPLGTLLDRFNMKVHIDVSRAQRFIGQSLNRLFLKKQYSKMTSWPIKNHLFYMTIFPFPFNYCVHRKSF